MPQLLLRQKVPASAKNKMLHPITLQLVRKVKVLLNLTTLHLTTLLLSSTKCIATALLHYTILFCQLVQLFHMSNVWLVYKYHNGMKQQIIYTMTILPCKAGIWFYFTDLFILCSPKLVKKWIHAVVTASFEL